MTSTTPAGRTHVPMGTVRATPFMDTDYDLQDSLWKKFHRNVSSTARPTHIEFCGRSVLIRYHDAAIRERFRPAIRHLETSNLSDSSDLEIFCFATRESPRQWLEEKKLSTAINQTISNSLLKYCYQGHSLFVFDPVAKRAFYWVDAPSRFDLYRARPFTRILAWYAEHQRLTWTHAACVGISGGAVVIPAAGGSGKSTAAAACLLSDLLYVGDDFVVLNKQCCGVSSVYCNMMLSAQSIHLLRVFDRVQMLKPQFHDKKNKDCYQLFENFDQQLQSGLPLKGVLVPAIVTGKSKLVPTNKSEAIRAFISSLQIGRILGLNPNLMLKDFHSMVQQLPTCKLEIGGDLESIPGLISQFMTHN